MNVQYKISVTVRTLTGRAQVADFFLGDDIEFANETFRMLRGIETVDNNVFIRADLVKKKEGNLPVKLTSIACTLNEYAENCKIITREVFKRHTL